MELSPHEQQFLAAFSDDGVRDLVKLSLQRHGHRLELVSQTAPRELQRLADELEADLKLLAV